MQAEESPRAVSSERSGLKPTTAFLLLLSGAVLVATIVYLTRPTPAPTPTGTPATTQPNFALTNEEAITKFEELQATQLEAYKLADPSLADGLFTPDSPIAPMVQRELRTLVRDQVSAVTIFETKSLKVISNEPRQIQLEQDAVVTGRFLDAEGRDISARAPVQRQTITWILRLVGTSWRIHDAVVEASQVIRN